MAHYDHRGGVGPHVRRQVESVAAAVDRMIVVSTAALTDESRAWLDERVELVERPNYGYDFTSYQVGLHRAGLAGDLTSYDEVVRPSGISPELCRCPGPEGVTSIASVPLREEFCMFKLLQQTFNNLF